MQGTVVFSGCSAIVNAIGFDAFNIKRHVHDYAQNNCGMSKNFFGKRTVDNEKHQFSTHCTYLIITVIVGV